MPETIIESALSGKLEHDLLFKWLNDETVEGAPDDCILLCTNRNEFVAFFLSYLREQTDSILQTNTNTLSLPLQSTPEKSQRKHHRSISDPTCDNDKSNDSVCAKSERKTQESPNRDRKKTGRRVKTKLFSDDKTKENNSSDESRLSTGVDRLLLSSTPMKNGFKEYQNLPASPVTPQSRSFREYERCDTPRVGRHSRSQDKNVSLGDYLVNIQPKSNKKKRSKNTSNDDSDPKLDLSNSEMFPEIGARKSSSLKSERRRIKPTNIDTNKKSYSLNSFTSENFQQMSPLALEENLAFKPKLQPRECSNSFDAERNLLKQERHKLMEKFNVLNTTSTPKVTTPQIKILQKEEKTSVYIEAEANKITFKDKIDILVDIYDVLLKNNLILSINTEIYFLITILLSKQTDEDHKKEFSVESNLADNIMKNIHNSTYFAVKSLWNLRTILEVILDKNSLKILGENRKVRSFFPDLAKFLLNSYGLKCEAESQDRSKNATRNRCSDGIICFNQETDNAENFPSILSFQNFKKQRDMFYEILRWYRSAGASPAGASPAAALRARVRSLLAAGPGAHNHHHLAALVARLLLDAPIHTESKLNKLRMRLTRPSGDTQRPPHFTDEEMFYKDFIMCADNECFRVHLKHALSTEIVALDAACIGEASNGSDVSKEFLQLSKKLGLLAKFLGYLTSLPYSQIPIDLLLKTGAVNLNSQKEEIFTVPKEKVLENNIALRNYSQPGMDIQGILLNANNNRRLAITLPWIIQYLSLLDYTTLRLKYYQNLLKILYDIYKKINLTTHKKNTVIFLKLNLGWLFDLPHFPQEVLYIKSELSISVRESEFDVEEIVLQELCPYLKDLSVLLSTSRVNQESNRVGSFRHITPVSLSLNTEDRIRNKEKELQMRLEEELIKSQPSSTRRVLELVTERVTSAAVKELTSSTLVEARKKARIGAASLVAGWKEQDRSGLLASLRAHYSSQLSSLRACALRSSRALVSQRAAAALAALLPAAPAPLRAVAAAACARRLSRWLEQHWGTTDILCKDIESEMHNLESVGLGVTSTSEAVDLVTCDLDALESPAQAIMDLKEQICVALEGGSCSYAVLRACARACARRNVFCRAPALTALLHLSVDYCVVYVSRQSSKVIEILPELNAIWEQCCPNRRQEVEQTEPGSDDERIERGPEPQKCEDSLSYFDRILCPRNIMLLSDSKCSSEVWSALAEVLVFLLKQNYLCEDSLTEQCLAVYKQDWPQNILENLSTCMKTVSSRWSSTGKFTLFLDFLADFCNDMDYDLIE